MKYFCFNCGKEYKTLDFPCSCGYWPSVFEILNPDDIIKRLRNQVRLLAKAYDFLRAATFPKDTNYEIKMETGSSKDANVIRAAKSFCNCRSKRLLCQCQCQKAFKCYSCRLFQAVVNNNDLGIIEAAKLITRSRNCKDYCDCSTGYTCWACRFWDAVNQKENHEQA